jgi:hypothetical protein
MERPACITERNIIRDRFIPGRPVADAGVTAQRFGSSICTGRT